MDQLALNFRLEATVHIQEAFESYSELSDRRLARLFLQSLDDAILHSDIFEQLPHLCRQTRRIRLDPFPYWLYFQAKDGGVEVVAMLHIKRDPSKNVWQRG